VRSLNLKTLLTLLLILILGACGGGTEGTGGVTISGKLQTANSQPVAGVSVTVEETGDSAVTDQNGDFVIQTDRISNATLAFEDDKLAARATVNNIPNSATRVDVTCVLDRERNNVTVKESESSDDSGSHGNGNGSGSGNSNGGSGSSNNDGRDSNDDSSDHPDNNGGGGSDSNSTDDAGNDSSGSGQEDNGKPGSEDGGQQEVIKRDVRGSISAISGTSITVAGVTFVISQDTEIRGSNGKPASIADFKLGDPVRVKGEGPADAIVAEKIEYD